MSKVIEHKIAGYPSPGGPVVLVHVLTHDETMKPGRGLRRRAGR
jgi:hypothetical protein